MQLHILRDGQARTIPAREGETVLKALQRAGISISAPCAGRCYCGQCRIQADVAEWLPEEAALLSDKERAEGVHLACALRVRDGLRVVLNAEGAASIWVEGESSELQLDPNVRAQTVQLAPPTLTANGDDLARLAQALHCPALAEAPDSVSLDTLATLPQALRAANWKVTARFRHEPPCLLDIGHTAAYGMAVDIGTTTLAAYLLDLGTGHVVDVAAMLNPQRVLGADVISRMQNAATPEARGHMRGLIVEALDALAKTLMHKQALDTADILEIVAVGNPAMLHLLFGASTEAMGVTPFVSAFSSRRATLAAALGIAAHPQARVVLLPSISAYVGADTVAAVLASSLHERAGHTLLVDIGTNGEIVLGGKAGLLCCSTAAGPAFEGAHIACGMGGVTGAIHSVRLEGETLALGVLGGGEASGICGSGLVDAVALALSQGWIDDMGRFDREAMPEALRCEAEGKPALKLSERVYISQKDIREVQLAKAAIAAGIQALLKEAGCALEDVQALLLAGGFGNTMDIDNACAIGLLPLALRAKVRTIGNAAGAGARMALCDREAMRAADAVARSMRYLELGAHPDFQDWFVDNMRFGDDEDE